MVPDNLSADLDAVYAALDAEAQAYDALAQAQAQVAGIPELQAAADAARQAREGRVQQLEDDLAAWHMAGPVTLAAKKAKSAAAGRAPAPHPSTPPAPAGRPGGK